MQIQQDKKEKEERKWRKSRKSRKSRKKLLMRRQKERKNPSPYGIVWCFINN